MINAQAKSTNSFFLDDVEETLSVKSGFVDLFLAEVKGDETLRLRPLARAESLDVIFPLPRVEGLRILATSSPGTNLEQQGFSESLNSVDKWITLISSALPEGRLPTETQLGEAEEKISFETDGFASPINEILWAELISGAAEEPSFGSISSPLPITKEQWLCISANTEIIL